MSVVIDAPSTTDSSLPAPESGSDPVIDVARAAGRLAGERLSHVPLTPRQRATVATVIGGAR